MYHKADSLVPPDSDLFACYWNCFYFFHMNLMFMNRLGTLQIELLSLTAKVAQYTFQQCLTERLLSQRHSAWGNLLCLNVPQFLKTPLSQTLNRINCNLKNHCYYFIIAFFRVALSTFVCNSEVYHYWEIKKKRPESCP